MANEIDLLEIKSLFDLPVEKKSDEDGKKKLETEMTSDVYGSSPSTAVSESFEDRVKELSSMLDEEDDNIPIVQEPIQENDSKDPLKVITAVVENVNKLGKDQDEVTEVTEVTEVDIDVVLEENKGSVCDDSSTTGEDLLEISSNKDVKKDELPEFDDDSDAEIIPTKNSVKPGQWDLESTASKYDSFYYNKKDMVENCCPGGRIPFESWRNELRESSVDVTVMSFDPKEIHIKMQKLRF